MLNLILLFYVVAMFIGLTWGNWPKKDKRI